MWRRYAIYLWELQRVAMERDHYGSIDMMFRQWQRKFIEITEMYLEAVQIYEKRVLENHFGEWRQRVWEEREKTKQAQLEELASNFANSKLAKKALLAMSESFETVKSEEQASSRYMEMKRLRGWMLQWRDRYLDQMRLRQAWILRSQLLQRRHFRVWKKEKDRRRHLVTLLVGTLTLKMQKSFIIWRDKTKSAVQLRYKYDDLRTQTITFLTRKRRTIFKGR